MSRRNVQNLRFAFATTQSAAHEYLPNSAMPSIRKDDATGQNRTLNSILSSVSSKSSTLLNIQNRKKRLFMRDLKREKSSPAPHWGMKAERMEAATSVMSLPVTLNALSLPTNNAREAVSTTKGPANDSPKITGSSRGEATMKGVVFGFMSCLPLQRRSTSLPSRFFTGDKKEQGVSITESVQSIPQPYRHFFAVCSIVNHQCPDFKEKIRPEHFAPRARSVGYLFAFTYKRLGIHFYNSSAWGILIKINI